MSDSLIRLILGIVSFSLLAGFIATGGQLFS